MTSFEALLRALGESRVDFILVGGLAGIAHGSSRLTQDVDIVYDRSIDNIGRLVAAMAPLRPYLRGAPPGLPFRFDEPTVKAGLNFTLETTAGDLDALGEIAGGGTHASLLPHTIEVVIYGVRCRCLDLATLIRTKRAAGRPKDLEAIAELNELLALGGG